VEILVEGEHNTSTTDKISPPKDALNECHFQKGGDVGDSGDNFRLPHMLKIIRKLTCPRKTLHDIEYLCLRQIFVV
jgi:hypothetical protein